MNFKSLIDDANTAADDIIGNSLKRAQDKFHEALTDFVEAETVMGNHGPNIDASLLNLLALVIAQRVVSQGYEPGHGPCTTAVVFGQYFYNVIHAHIHCEVMKAEKPK